MKKTKKLKCAILLIVTLVLCFGFSVSAESEDYLNEFSAIIPDRFSEKFDNYDSLAEAVGINSLVEIVLGELSGEGGQIVSFYFLLLGILALASVSTFGAHGMKLGVRRALSILFCAAMLAAVFPILSSLQKSLAEANSFFSSAAPILCAVNAAGGGVGSAAVGAAGMSISSALVGTVASKLLPFVAVFGFAASLLKSFGGADVIVAGAKNIYTRILGALTFLISITISMQSIIASAEDSAAMRAAKYGISTMLPAVGGVVSSALGTLTGGLSYVKSVVGASALAVILYIFLSPLIILFLYRIGISVALAVSELIGVKEAVPFGTFLSVLDAFTASYVLSALTYILQIILFMRGGASA